MTQLTEGEAYNQACVYVAERIEQTTCVSDDDATAMACGFVTGFLHGLRKGAQGTLIVQDSTAKAYWRGNWDDALAFDRSIQEDATE